MYFRINLNKLEDPALQRRRELLATARFALVNAGLLALLIVAIYWNTRLSGKVRAFEQQRTDLTTQIRQLETGRGYISEQEVRDLYSLDKDRVFWSRKLESLAALAGDDIALTSVKLQNGRLYLEGIARVKKSENSFNTVSGLIERIKQEPAYSRDFKRIEFGSSSRIDFMDQPILHFEILCFPK